MPIVPILWDATAVLQDTQPAQTILLANLSTVPFPFVCYVQLQARSVTAVLLDTLYKVDSAKVSVEITY